MIQKKNLLSQEHGVKHRHGQQAGNPQRYQPCVAQPKIGAASQMKKPPLAPPVYHPQPILKVLQTKSAQGQPSHIGQRPGQPTLPTVHRPEQRSIAQPKVMPVAQKSPAAPPIYRPEQKRIVQSKMAATIQARTPPKSPPVYRPQPTPRVLQTNSSQQLVTAAGRKLHGQHNGCNSQSTAAPCSGSIQRKASLLPLASTLKHATVQVKGKAAQVNPGRNSATPNQRTLRGGSHVVQRVINHDLSTVVSLKDQKVQGGTYTSEMAKMAKLAEKLKRTVKYYDTLKPADDLDTAKETLWYVIKRSKDLQNELDGIFKYLAPTQNQSKEDKEAYRVMVKFQDDLTKLSKAANNEAATILKITRAGAGNRPDANSESALNRTLGNGLNLTNTEKNFLSDFVTKQGGSWKEQREALSAIWATRLHQFTTLKPGKGNTYNKDVEYLTTDAGKPQLWDQKTIFTDHTPFDGRLVHTHDKNVDSNNHGVGILLDSTFENETNYEKVWLGVNELVLSGKIAASAVKEVRAPNLDAFHSDLYVDMSYDRYQSGSVEKNIMWAETNLANQKQGGYDVILKAKVAGTNYSKVVDGTATTHSRYTNDRNWLPFGIYDEYAVKGVLPDEGSGRFVATEDRSEIYLSVTHYKPYTVKHNNKVVNRKAFFRII